MNIGFIKDYIENLNNGSYNIGDCFTLLLYGSSNRDEFDYFKWLKYMELRDIQEEMYLCE